MNDPPDPCDPLLRLGARRLTGYQRRLFQAEVCLTLRDGNPRLAERRFGWGRHTVAKGLKEYQSGIRWLENFPARGARRSEAKNLQLAADIRAIAEPQTYADPELKSAPPLQQPIRRRGSPRLENHQGVCQGRFAPRAHDAGHPQPPGATASSACKRASR